MNMLVGVAMDIITDVWNVDKEFNPGKYQDAILDATEENHQKMMELIDMIKSLNQNIGPVYGGVDEDDTKSAQCRKRAIAYFNFSDMITFIEVLDKETHQ